MLPETPITWRGRYHSLESEKEDRPRLCLPKLTATCRHYSDTRRELDRGRWLIQYRTARHGTVLYLSLLLMDGGTDSGTPTHEGKSETGKERHDDRKKDAISPPPFLFSYPERTHDQSLRLIAGEFFLSACQYHDVNAHSMRTTQT